MRAVTLGAAAAALAGCAEADDAGVSAIESDNLSSTPSSPEQTDTAPSTPSSEAEPDTIPPTSDPIDMVDPLRTIRVATFPPVDRADAVDPAISTDIGSVALVGLQFEYLVGGEGATGLAPMLAESWSSNGDGTVWTFVLRRGVKWHDGVPLVADDVVTSMDRAVNQGAFFTVEPVCRAIDDHTLEMSLPQAEFRWVYEVSAHNPGSAVVRQSSDSSSPSGLVGTGPYLLGPMIEDVLVFDANPDHWDAPPTIDRVEVHFMTTVDEMVNELLDDAVDVVAPSFALPRQLPPSFGVDVDLMATGAHRQIWMNTREGTFSDQRVRMAIALAVDRQALIDTIFDGWGSLGNDHPVAPVFAAWDATLAQRERDVDQARNLLREAGQENLAITLHAPDLAEIPLLASLLSIQLADAGVSLTVNVEPTTTFYDRWCRIYDSQNAPAGCDGGEEFGIVDYGTRPTPDYFLRKAFATGEWNSAHYNSADFREAFGDYVLAADDAGQLEAASRVQRLAHEDVPYVIPYFIDMPLLRRQSVSGLRATVRGQVLPNKATKSPAGS